MANGTVQMLRHQADPDRGGRRRRLRWPRGVLGRTFLAAATALLVVVGLITAQALTAPGNDSVAAKLAEAARNYGLGFVVTGLENLQYQLNPPRVGGRPDASALKELAGTRPLRVPHPGATAGTAADSIPVQPTLTPIDTPALPGEGVFRPVVSLNGQPVMQVAYLRPDAQHTSYLSGVVWMSGSRLRLVQHPGASDPGQLSTFNMSAVITSSQRTGLLGTFNSGFKIKDSRGGYYQNGASAGTLTPGAASLVVYRDGHTDIGSWGSDVRMSSSVVSVRQNLKLLVDGGKVAPDINANVQSTWGATVKGATYVWRSGIGITSSGDLVYVAGDALSARSLADLLVRAGAVRAMQLDINASWVSFMWYTASGSSGPVPHKLTAFERPADRYFSVSSRDFFAVYAR